MQISRITSRDNPIIKTARMVASQSRKAPPDIVLAEGIRVLEEVLKSGHPIECVVVADGFGSDERESRFVRGVSDRHVRIYQASAKLLKGVSDVLSPQGAIALVKVSNRSISCLNLEKNSLLICADALQDPGNLGTLIRSALAAGAVGILTTTETASLKNPKTIRASAGAIFHLPWIENMGRRSVSSFCREKSIPIFLSSTSRGRPYWDVDFKSGGIIVLGNESRGLSELNWPEADFIRIPMEPHIESLNVAMAGTVILFEAFRQRYQAAGGP